MVFDLIHIPQSVICIAPIQSNIPTSFDREIRVRPWTIKELQPHSLKEDYDQHVGYAPLMTDSNDGWTQLNQCMQQMISTHPLAQRCLQGLLKQSHSLLELAQQIQALPPQSRTHTLNQMRDWIHSQESVTSKDTQFMLHPVAALWTRRAMEVDHVQPK